MSSKPVYQLLKLAEYITVAAKRPFIKSKNDELLEIGMAALEDDDRETVNDVLQELYGRKSRKAQSVLSKLEKVLEAEPEPEPKAEKPVEPEPEPEPPKNKPVYLDYDEQQKLVQDAITEHRARFGEVFGLRAFPGDRYTIDERASFYSPGAEPNEWYPEGKEPSVQIVLDVERDGEWRSMGRGSTEELNRESVKLPEDKVALLANFCEVFLKAAGNN
jgi:hypothetical protein